MRNMRKVHVDIERRLKYFESDTIISKRDLNAILEATFSFDTDSVEELNSLTKEEMYKRVYEKIKAGKIKDLTELEKTLYNTIAIFAQRAKAHNVAAELRIIRKNHLFDEDEIVLIQKYAELLFNITDTIPDKMEEMYNPHITAKARTTISLPLKYVLNSIITLEELKDKKVLDYGCGRGFDVEYLQSVGINATGYDKYASNPIYLKKPTGKFDVVYCFYVFNVIKSLEEHEHTLQNLLSYSRDLSIIALRNDIEQNKKDSWIYDEEDDIYNTGRSFQRGYTPETIKKYFPGFNIVKTTSQFILLVR